MKRARFLSPLLVVVVGVSIIWLNLHRLYVEMPEKNGLHPLSLATKYVQENEGDMRYYYILPERVSFWAKYQVEAYGLSDRVEVYEPDEIFDDPSRIRPPCEVIVSTLEPEKVRKVMSFLQKRFFASAPSVIEGPPGGPWRLWGISDIYIIPIEGARPRGDPAFT